MIRSARGAASMVAAVLLIAFGDVAGTRMLASNPTDGAQLPTAPPITPRAALERLFMSSEIDAAWFAPEFIAQVSVAQVRSIIVGFRPTLGAYLGVEPTGDAFVVRFANGTVPARISLDSSGRIVGLLFQQPTISDPATMQQRVLELIAALPGTVSVLVTRDDAEAVAVNADRPLAVGSAFKLAVLNALQGQVASGERAWADLVPLRAAWRSLPSGVLQATLPGTPFALTSYAALMMSISDNTATDALIAIVGRGNVERYGAANVPFLTTREAFVLKDPANADLLARWRTGETAAHRAVLAEAAARPMPSADLFQTGPQATDVEWFFSTRQLCGLIEAVAALPAMQLNPGLADPTAWRSVAYKGGSEPGVLNLTHRLTAQDGSTRCVSVTWNSAEALDERALTSLVGLLIASLP